MEGVLQAIVGANIRRLRTAQGLSQESFGEHVGWHRTFVGAVERGERNLTLKSVERISDTLGVHPLDLLWDRAGVTIEVGPDRVPHLTAAGPTAPAALRAAEGGRSGAPGDAAPDSKRTRPGTS